MSSLRFQTSEFLIFFYFKNLYLFESYIWCLIFYMNTNTVNIPTILKCAITISYRCVNWVWKPSSMLLLTYWLIDILNGISSWHIILNFNIEIISSELFHHYCNMNYEIKAMSAFYPEIFVLYIQLVFFVSFVLNFGLSCRIKTCTVHRAYVFRMLQTE